MPTSSVETGQSVEASVMLDSARPEAPVSTVRNVASGVLHFAEEILTPVLGLHHHDPVAEKVKVNELSPMSNHLTGVSVTNKLKFPLPKDVRG